MCSNRMSFWNNPFCICISMFIWLFPSVLLSFALYIGANSIDPRTDIHGILLLVFFLVFYIGGLLSFWLPGWRFKEYKKQRHTRPPQMSTRYENTVSRAEQSPEVGLNPRAFLNQSPLSVIQLTRSYETRGHQTSLDRRDNPYCSVSAPAYEFPDVTQPHYDQTTVASLDLDPPPPYSEIILYPKKDSVPPPPYPGAVYTPYK